MPHYSRRWRPAGLVLIPGGHIGNHSPPLSTRLAGRRGCSVVDCRVLHCPAEQSGCLPDSGGVGVVVVLGTAAAAGFPVPAGPAGASQQRGSQCRAGSPPPPRQLHSGNSGRGTQRTWEQSGEQSREQGELLGNRAVGELGMVGIVE